MDCESTAEVVVNLDVLVKPDANVGTAGAIASVHKWFADRQIELFPTRFGLSGRTTKEKLAGEFNVPESTIDEGGELVPPKEIAGLVDLITFSPPVTYYSS